MKKRLSLFLSLLALVACTSEYDKLLNEASRTGKTGEDTFYATIEDAGTANPQTKVYADDRMRVLWNANDEISIFEENTYNQPFRFTGDDGDNAGEFTKVSKEGYATGGLLSHTYAVYPYDNGTKISYDGVLTVSLPAQQHFLAHSFGIGANTMVSVTDDKMLRFKNAGGYLSFKLYGDGVSVKSITLKGNNHEKLAGKASVTMPVGGNPAVVMQNDATESVTLICDKPVALNASAEKYTEFWFVIPPTTFSLGFTVAVTDEYGGVFTQNTSNPVSISRNHLSRMASMEVVPDYAHSYVPFADSNFKTYCVDNFDTDHDGEISIAEAQEVTKIDVKTNEITSLGGIEYFSNLTDLIAVGSSVYDSETRTWNYLSGQLTVLDVSQNKLLKEITCSGNQLSKLIVSGCGELTILRCYNNKLTSLDVSQNTNLEVLSCGGRVGNQLRELNLSNNPKLFMLACHHNCLSSLDLSQNSALTYLDCGYNQLSSLDIRVHTALTNLYCDNNQLTVLDVTKNTALESLLCDNNQLKNLDLSNNALLFSLSCSNNQLTSLDICYNTGLTSVNCDNNQLSAIDISYNVALRRLSCKNNKLSSLDLRINTLLEEINCTINFLSSLNVAHNTALTLLQCDGNPGLQAIWIKSGQTINTFEYDPSVSTVYDCFDNFSPFDTASDALYREVEDAAAGMKAMINSIKNLKSAIQATSYSFASFDNVDSLKLFDAIIVFAIAREKYLDFRTSVQNIDPLDPAKRDSSIFYYSMGKSGAGKPIFAALKFSALTWDQLVSGEYEYTTAYPGDVKFVDGYPDVVVNAFANIVDQLGSELSTMFDFTNHAVVSPFVYDLSTALFGKYKIDSWSNPTKIMKVDGSEYIPQSLIKAENYLVNTLNRYILNYNLCWNENVAMVTKDTPAVADYISAMRSGRSSDIASAKETLIAYMDELCPTVTLNP